MAGAEDEIVWMLGKCLISTGYLNIVTEWAQVFRPEMNALGKEWA